MKKLTFFIHFCVRKISIGYKLYKYTNQKHRNLALLKDHLVYSCSIYTQKHTCQCM